MKPCSWFSPAKNKINLNQKLNMKYVKSELYDVEITQAHALLTCVRY